MANIKSAKKRNRQNIAQNARNREVRSSVLTASKRVTRLMDSKTEKDPGKLQELLKSYIKIIDNAAQRGVIHNRTSARKKSRLSKRVNSFLTENAG